jgi:Domain of unknown function (DUF4157)
MKTAEPKSAAQQHKTSAQSFFNQGQEQSFFSAHTSEQTSFFPTNAQNLVQPKAISGQVPFFSQTSVPTIQQKCATCESEESSQREAALTPEPPTVQKMPGFESDRAIQSKSVSTANSVAPPAAIPKPQQNADTKEIVQQEESTAETPQIQMMPAFSSAGDPGDGDDAHTALIPMQFSLKIGQPGDTYEREADAMADRVVSMPRLIGSDVTPKTLSAPQPQRVSRKHMLGMRALMRQKAEGNQTPAPKHLENRLQQAQGSGKPLEANTRTEMEGAFGADFSGVQVHTGQESAALNQSLGARAFTHGNDIFFNSGEYQPQSQTGKHLLAHELTHTMQQGASVQRSMQSEPMIQKSSWLDDLIDFGEDVGWRIVREFAPGLEPILRKGPEGIFEWIKDLVGSAIEGVFDKLMTPMRALAGIDSQLVAHFAPLLASIQIAASKIAGNDCTPISEAAEKIEQAAVRLITPIIEKLQPVVAKIKDFLNGLWDKIGAPIWGWIQQYASAEWAKIQWLGQKLQNVASWIWNKTASIRALADKMWTWFKNKLGIGEGAEGKDGLLQWVQSKIDAAWTTIKAKLEPFKQQLISIGVVVGGVALALSPAGPLLAVGAAVAGAVQGFRWISANWGKGSMIVQARTYLEKSLIPTLLGAANRLGAAVTRMASGVSSSLGSLATGMLNAVSAIGSSFLRVAVSVVQWIADKVTALADWAKQTLSDFSHWLEETLNKLQSFLHKMLDFLMEVGKVVLDIWLLPALLAKTVWNWIPQCIRDPIIDFIGPIILRQIEIFRELAKDKVAWQKTKADVTKIIHLVFTDHDLMGAVKATFYLILRVFNVPPELLATIAQKALSAWDAVSKNPIEFIKNTVRALGKGFQLLWKNIGEHLKFGLQDWLFGELAEKNISPPASWTEPKDIFFFVLDVLGLSINHLWELLAQRFPPEKVAKVRQLFGQVTRATDWINKAIDTSKSPAENARGIVDQAKDFGMSILTGIAEWVAGKVAEELAILAAGAAASGGLSEVLDVVRRIYKAIKTAVRWARRILEMVNETFDNILNIAAGNIEPVGVKFEQIMHRGMPVVIGFLADQVGLGGVGEALRDIVDTLREKIDEAILWLIDKIKAGIEALIGAVKAGVGALLAWWRKEVSFNSKNGSPHRVFLKGEKDNPQIMIASNETEALKFLNEKKSSETEKEQISAIDTAISKYQLITDKKAELIAIQSSRESASDLEKKEIDKKIDREDNALYKLFVELSKQLEKLNFSDDLDSSIARSQVNVSSGDMPSQVTALPLTEVPGNTSGSRPTRDINVPDGWANVKTIDPENVIWVKAHLISESFHGPGQRGNLVPTRKTTNGQMSTEEADVKKYIKSNKVAAWYEVNVEYHKGSDPIHNFPLTPFPSEITMTWGKAKKSGTTWSRGQQEHKQVIPSIAAPSFSGSSAVVVNINDSSVGRQAIADATGISEYYARKIVNERNRNGKFNNVFEMYNRLQAMPIKYDLKIRDAEKAGKIIFG